MIPTRTRSCTHQGLDLFLTEQQDGDGGWETIGFEVWAGNIDVTGTLHADDLAEYERIACEEGEVDEGTRGKP